MKCSIDVLSPSGLCRAVPDRCLLKLFRLSSRSPKSTLFCRVKLMRLLSTVGVASGSMLLNGSFFFGWLCSSSDEEVLPELARFLDFWEDFFSSACCFSIAKTKRRYHLSKNERFSVLLKKIVLK